MSASGSHSKKDPKTILDEAKEKLKEKLQRKPGAHPSLFEPDNRTDEASIYQRRLKGGVTHDVDSLPDPQPKPKAPAK